MLSRQVGNRMQGRIGRHNELERCVVHREQGPRGAELPAGGPISSAIPSLLRDAQGDKCQLDLPTFEQLDVFCRPLGRTRNNRQT
jgi:hypothetical protein